MNGKSGKRQSGIITFLIVSVLFFAVSIEAATLPAYERLQPVTESLDSPVAVALDAKENLYVAETLKNRINIYSPSGRHIETLVGLDRPISVAVDGSGKIYVG